VLPAQQQPQPRSPPALPSQQQVPAQAQPPQPLAQQVAAASGGSAGSTPAAQDQQQQQQQQQPQDTLAAVLFQNGCEAGKEPLWRFLDTTGAIQVGVEQLLRMREGDRRFEWCYACLLHTPAVLLRARAQLRACTLPQHQ
jgi:hypothetical protein